MTDKYRRHHTCQYWGVSKADRCHNFKFTPLRNQKKFLNAHSTCRSLIPTDGIRSLPPQHVAVPATCARLTAHRAGCRSCDVPKQHGEYRLATSSANISSHHDLTCLLSRAVPFPAVWRSPYHHCEDHLSLCGSYIRYFIRDYRSMFSSLAAKPLTN